MRIIDADQYAVEMKMRQDAVQAIVEHPIADRYYTDKEHWEGVMLAFVEAKLTLDKMPTVDAAPVKHGRWKKTNNPSYSPFDGSSEHISICSNCAYSREQHDFLYCPNCGAKMDIGAENDGIETEDEADDNR